MWRNSSCALGTDKTLLKFVSECEVFDDSLTDTILDNSYTSKLDAFHKEDIVEKMKINLITKRLCYIRQFSKGFKLFNTYEAIKRNSDVYTSLFIPVPGVTEEVDANYIYVFIGQVTLLRRRFKQTAKRERYH
mgnify:CR=1 FL=1